MTPDIEQFIERLALIIADPTKRAQVAQHIDALLAAANLPTNQQLIVEGRKHARPPL